MKAIAISLLTILVIGMPHTHSTDWYGTHPAERHATLRSCGFEKKGVNVAREFLRANPTAYTDDSPRTQNCINAQYAQDYFGGRVTVAGKVATPPPGYLP